MVSIELWFNLDNYYICMEISRVPCLNEVLYYMGKQYRVTFVEHYLGDKVIVARVMAEDYK